MSMNFISCDNRKETAVSKSSHQFNTSNLIGTWHCNYSNGLDLVFSFDIEGRGIYEERTNTEDANVWYDIEYGIKDSTLIINLVDHEETDRYEIKSMNDKKMIILSEYNEKLILTKE